MNTFEKALTLFRDTGWGKGSLYNHNRETYCALGGLSMALTGVAQYSSDGGPFPAEVHTLAQLIREQYPDWYEKHEDTHRRVAIGVIMAAGSRSTPPPPCDDEELVFYWNDELDRKWEQVEALFEKAAAVHDA